MKQKSRIFAIKQGKMNTAELKADLYKLIDKTEDISILKALRTLLIKQFANDKAESDFWDELPEALKNEIEKGLEEIEAGEEISHEKVMKKYEKWL
jgi:predicted transcriptional regulator